MPFKTSDNLRHQQYLWKAALSCDEVAAAKLAAELASELSAGAWVLLEGPMGAGKSTFARFMLQELGYRLAPEGSPTFAIAHEYAQESMPRVIHLDLYRIEDEDELDAAGIPAFFWESPDSIVISEWTSNWPRLEEALVSDTTHSLWLVDLDFTPDEPGRREIKVYRR